MTVIICLDNPQIEFTWFCRLSYLHSQKIVHRDVKTENMLLDKTRTVKIADFGVARMEASNPNDMTGETGTLGYMAPEVCIQYQLEIIVQACMAELSISANSCSVHSIFHLIGNGYSWSPYVI